MKLPSKSIRKSVATTSVAMFRGIFADDVQQSGTLEAGGKLVCQGTVMDASLVSKDPEVMSGVLCFTGTRVPVQNLFDYLEGRSSIEDFLDDFPAVSRQRAIAVLEAARQHLMADAPAA